MEEMLISQSEMVVTLMNFAASFKPVYKQNSTEEKQRSRYYKEIFCKTNPKYTIVKFCLNRNKFYRNFTKKIQFCKCVKILKFKISIKRKLVLYWVILT